MSEAALKLDQYSPAIVRSAALELLAQTYRQSLFATCRRLLAFEDITKRTHTGIIKNLESDTRRKLICVPRGTFKSSIAVIGYTIWRILNNPNIRILIDSEVFTNSKNFLRSIKAHLESDKFTQLFGDHRGDKWGEAEIIVKTRTKALKEATVTCGGVGTVKVGQHYDLIIGDDYNSNKNSATPEGRKKVIDHYKYNQSILEPDGTYVIIGTRYSEDDVIGDILANELDIREIQQINDYEKDNGVIYV